MNQKIAPKDNSSNMENANKGTPGTNLQYDQNQGNRGNQMAEHQQTKDGVAAQDKTVKPGKGT